MRSAGRNVIEREHGAASSAFAAAAAQNTTENSAGTEQAPRSSYGSVPGDEFPAAVYLSVLAAFAWIMLASWLAFAGDADASLALSVAIVLAIVFFALPIIIRQVAAAHSRGPREVSGDFATSCIETATGPLTGSSAWLQVLLIPMALALAATLIGTTYVLVR